MYLGQIDVKRDALYDFFHPDLNPAVSVICILFCQDHFKDESSVGAHIKVSLSHRRSPAEVTSTYCLEFSLRPPHRPDNECCAIKLHLGNRKVTMPIAFRRCLGTFLIFSKKLKLCSFFFFTLSAKVIKEKGKKEGVDTSEICDWTKRVGKLSQAGPS